MRAVLSAATRRHKKRIGKDDIMVEIKLRRKGEVIKVEGFPIEKISEAIRPKDGLKGIDLTGYSVIFVSAGRRGKEKAQRIFSETNTIVVYKYEWYNGWGEGVFLPESFNPSRAVFYKTDEQKAKEKSEAEKMACEKLRDAVISAIPKVRVYLSTYSNWSGVKISPEQEVFSMDWGVSASNLEEAISKVAQTRSLWDEWNTRAIEAYCRVSGKENPGIGNIEIVPSPTRENKVGVRIEDRKWVIFEKQEDSSWKETGESCHAPTY